MRRLTPQNASLRLASLALETSVLKHAPRQQPFAPLSLTPRRKNQNVYTVQQQSSTMAAAGNDDAGAATAATPPSPAHAAAPAGVHKLRGGQTAAPPPLSDPYQARRDVAPSAERPQGHYASPPGRTVLQQHMDFFDLNKDGVIHPWETLQALRFLRFAWEPLNTLVALWVTVLLHVMFSLPTQLAHARARAAAAGGSSGSGTTRTGTGGGARRRRPSAAVAAALVLPSLLWPIYIDAAPAARHCASSGTLDANGYFVPAAFEDIFARYAPKGRQYLTAADLARLVWDHSSWGNMFGSFATALQWGLAWHLLRDARWRLSKADARGLYDGSAFYRLADRNGHPQHGMAARRDAAERKHVG